MKNFIILFTFVFYFLVSFSAFSKQGYSQNQSYNQSQNFQEADLEFTNAELAQMLAPIALYPDSLLTHILISSTYPIEIVEAHRWLKKNTNLDAKQIARSIESFDWDASVKALVPFEQILSRLSEDLNWMQQLGDAFLQDQTRVLESIQLLREQARVAGSLGKMGNMNVNYEDNNIIIEPVKKEIVYVPYYDTRMVYGNWLWSSYPPVYWRPYSRVNVSYHNPFYWHSGVRISFNYFFSIFHWHKRHVVVVNPQKSHHPRSRRFITRGGYAKRWSHQPKHRRGVAYRTKSVNKKYYNTRSKSHQARKSSQHVQRDFKQRLSSKNNFSNKRKVNKKHARVDSEKPNKNKPRRANTRAKKERYMKDSPKNHKETPAKNSAKRNHLAAKKQTNISRKNNHSTLVNKRHSNRTKERH